MNTEKINQLYSGDTKLAYKNLLELENLCESSSELYIFFDEFLKMLNNEKSFVRVRGFRLICSLAKWDIENKINSSIDEILLELKDVKPTAVRQCLAALNKLLPCKPDLAEYIKNEVGKLNYLQYKETMQGLIKKDIESILKK